MSTVKIKRSGTTTSTPSSLDHGELAINYADATLFWKDSSNTIQSFVFQAYASATHKSTHATGGSDALTPADIGAAPAASPEFTGFVGINSNPSTRRLTVRGSSAADGALLLQSSSTGTGGSAGFIIQCFGANSNAYVWNFENAPIIFGANNAERMRLTAAGDLGLGPSRTAPASRLDVNGVITVAAGTAAAPALVASGDANTGVFFPAADTFAISTAGSERVRVKSTGAVRFVPLTADPGTADAGDVYYNSSTNKLRVYNGTSWIDLH